MNVRKTLVDLGCVLEGEFFFALKSGKISTKYINIDPLLTDPVQLWLVCNQIAKTMLSKSSEPLPEVIAGPATGAIPLVYLTSQRLSGSDFKQPQTVFAEKTADGFSLQRMGFAKTVRGKRVHVVEDITSSGESAKGTGEAIIAAGGIISGYTFIWNRNPEKINDHFMGSQTHSLISESVQSWEPGEHPEWGKWPLVTDIGHPEHFLDYPGPQITLLK